MKNVIVVIWLLVFHFSGAQSLEDLIHIALKNNPEIKKFDLEYQIANEKTNEVTTIPSTQFGVGYFVSEPETRTGAQRFKVSAMQMLPWFGSNTARKNYISSLADAQYEEIVIAKRKLIASVSQSYYNLYANKAKQEKLSENLKLLETYETLALTSVEVGKASAVDVLRLQMRQNEIQQLLDILKQQYISEQTTFNKILNREKTSEIEVIKALIIPMQDFEINLERLSLHPELLKYDTLSESIEKSELLNQKEHKPSIGFGLDYVNVEKRPELHFKDNGKDIIMPMVSLSIPLFNKKQRSITKQHTLQQDLIKTKKQDRFNRLETLLNKAVTTRASARIRYNTQLKNLQQAKNAETLLTKSYESGTINFNDVLDIQELQLNFQMHYIEAVKSYYIQTSIINYLTQL